METLARRDPEIARLMEAETARARGTLSLIASENASSPAVRKALGGGGSPTSTPKATPTTASTRAARP